MAFGLEGRVPFLDHRVVEFGLGLPQDLKVRGRQGKLFLKRWAERRLPREHLWRRKRGFYVPVGRWLRGNFLDELAGATARSPAHSPLVPAGGRRGLLRAHQAGGG